MKKKSSDTTEAFEKSVAAPPSEERYVLRLYVTGMTQRSTEAFATIKALCEDRLQVAAASGDQNYYRSGCTAHARI